MKQVPFLILSLLLGATVSAQVAPKPTPELSTSDKIALNALEKAKQDAEAAFKQSVTAEQSIFTEWKSSHPGFHVNPQTFAVEADPKPVPPTKPAVKEPVK